MRITTLLPVLSAVLAAVAIPVAHVDGGNAHVAAVQGKPAHPVASASAHPSKEALAHVDAAKVGRALAAVQATEKSPTTPTTVTTTTTATATPTKMAFKEVHAVQPKKVHAERTTPEHLSEDGAVEGEHEEFDARDLLSGAEVEEGNESESNQANGIDVEAVEVLNTLLRRLNKAQQDKIRIGYYGGKRGLTKAQQDKLRIGYYGGKRGLTKAQQDKLRIGYYGSKRGLTKAQQDKLRIGYYGGKKARGLTKAQQDKLRIGYYGA